ncbi:MAG TPA: 4Fe-4S binding protein [Thermodesulfovibrionales bacterium]|nr:4Fe-4S binding protein [Thermodesulfovibrionales bacterium]
MGLTVFRRVTQVSAIAFIIAIPLLSRDGITFLAGNLYSLAIGPVTVADPLIGFQVIISTLSFEKTLLLSMIIPLCLALVFGKVFCSWICPQNTISEYIDFLSRKTGMRRLFLMPVTAKPRYVILMVLFLLTPLAGFPLAAILSAPGIISLQPVRYVYEGAAGLELGLIGAIVLAEMLFARRLWCNYVCPIGSFLGIFRLGMTLKVVHRGDKPQPCMKCLECVKACQLGLNPMGGKIYPLCHNCGDCVAACERMNGPAKPLSFRFSRNA